LIKIDKLIKSYFSKIKSNPKNIYKYVNFSFFINLKYKIIKYIFLNISKKINLEKILNSILLYFDLLFVMIFLFLLELFEFILIVYALLLLE